MEAIGKPTHSAAKKLIILIRPVLAIAAVFLIGLYVYQSQEKEIQPALPYAAYDVSLKSVALSEKDCITPVVSLNQPKEIFSQYLHCDRREEAMQQQLKESLTNDRLSRLHYLLKVN